MPEIPLEDTPIFVKLVQEYAAREKFDEVFGPEDTKPLYAKTFVLRQGGITVYGDPIG